jgi:cell division protease FtsH
MALGGRVAEELVFNEITTGAVVDLEYITKDARDMVTRFGMSDKLGPMMFGKKEELIFLGREISEQRDYSEAIAEEIDREVRAIVNWAHDEAHRILTERREKLDAVAQRLLEVETVEAAEFLALMGEGALAEEPEETTAPPDSTPEAESQETLKGPERPTLGTAPSPA